MNSVVVVFAGEYDIACRDELRATLETLSDTSNVVLDFSAVTYVDSTVISELVRLHNRRAARGFKRETMVLQNESLQKIFDVLAMRRIFRFVRALDDVIGKNGDSATVQYALGGGEVSSRLAQAETG